MLGGPCSGRRPMSGVRTEERPVDPRGEDGEEERDKASSFMRAARRAVKPRDEVAGWNNQVPRVRCLRLEGARVRLMVLALAVSAVVASASSPTLAPTRATASFAGGCFWCRAGPFQSIPGVVSVTSGYTGGQKKYPTYEEVSAGSTGHAESVQIVYDPAKVTYDKLLEVFWHNVDPLTPNAQFCDHGSQYRSAIFYHGDAQKKAAEASKQAIEASGRFKQKIVTEIVAASKFYPAEEYHQDFYKKNPERYYS